MVRRSRSKQPWWRGVLAGAGLALLLALAPARAQIDIRPHLGLHSVPVRRAQRKPGPRIAHAFLSTNDDLRVLSFAAAGLFGAYLVARSQRRRLERQQQAQRQLQAQRQAQRVAGRKVLTR